MPHLSKLVMLFNILSPPPLLLNGRQQFTARGLILMHWRIEHVGVGGAGSEFGEADLLVIMWFAGHKFCDEIRPHVRIII